MMTRTTAWFVVVVMTVVLGIVLAGCATGPSSGPGQSQADLLKAAGFKAHTGHGAQLAYIQTLPAKKVVLNKYQEKPLYLVCTDPEAKQCFLGDEASYKRYQEMAIQQSIAEDQYKVMEERWDPQATQMWVDSQGGG